MEKLPRSVAYRANSDELLKAGFLSKARSSLPAKNVIYRNLRVGIYLLVTIGL